MFKTALLYCLITSYSLLTQCAIDPLDDCWNQQVRPLQTEFISFDYTEVENIFSHSMNPWDMSSYNIQGHIHFGINDFYKTDTLTTSRNRTYYSTKNIRNKQLYFLDYGEDELAAVSTSIYNEHMINSCRYTPTMIIDYFHKNKIQVSTQSNSSTSYQTKIGEYNVTLEISKATKLLMNIETLYDIESDDEYYGYGDVRDKFIYNNYKRKGDLHIPTTIIIEKLNGKLRDEILLDNCQISSEAIPQLETIIEPKENVELRVEPDVTIEQYADNIHFINLHHVGTRSLMVEFSDYIFVAEAPLNSKNGALLIDEVKKIAPDKPINYFAFGHFHPHYTGGMRPFIHEGAKIICTKEDQGYVQFIANSPHTINPDALQLDPKELQFEEVEGQKTISDASQEMVIYHIGSKSNHTNDYLIYYFPKEKMLFQDDLVRIGKNSTKENLSRTTKGLYNAIKDLNIEVEDIVQNWSVFDKSRSMKFKFSDIERILDE